MPFRDAKMPGRAKRRGRIVLQPKAFALGSRLVSDWISPGEISPNLAAHHLVIIAHKDCASRPKHAVRHAPRDRDKPNVFALRREHINPAAPARPEVTARVGLHTVAACALHLFRSDE